jgi:hypothetical protein
MKQTLLLLKSAYSIQSRFSTTWIYMAFGMNFAMLANATRQAFC